jgi:hypothetical protein
VPEHNPVEAAELCRGTNEAVDVETLGLEVEEPLVP